MGRGDPGSGTGPRRRSSSRSVASWIGGPGLAIVGDRVRPGPMRRHGRGGLARTLARAVRLRRRPGVVRPDATWGAGMVAIVTADPRWDRVLLTIGTEPGARVNRYVDASARELDRASVYPSSRQCAKGWGAFPLVDGRFGAIARGAAGAGGPHRPPPLSHTPFYSRFPVPSQRPDHPTCIGAQRQRTRRLFPRVCARKVMRFGERCAVVQGTRALASRLPVPTPIQEDLHCKVLRVSGAWF